MHPPPAASTSTQSHLPPLRFIHLYTVHFSLHLAFCNTFNVIRTQISHAIGQFSQKIRSCLFLLKIGAHGILEVLILNLDLGFWNSDPKISFGADLSQKSQSCPFYLNIGKRGISRIQILITTLAFWISNPKSIFERIWAEKVKVVCFAWKLARRVSRRC